MGEGNRFDYPLQHLYDSHFIDLDRNCITNVLNRVIWRKKKDYTGVGTYCSIQICVAVT